MATLSSVRATRRKRTRTASEGRVSAFQALTTAAHSFAWTTPQIRPSQYTAHHPIFLFFRASRFRYEGNSTGNPYHGYRRGSLFVQLLVLLRTRSGSRRSCSSFRFSYRCLSTLPWSLCISEKAIFMEGRRDSRGCVSWMFPPAILTW